MDFKFKKPHDNNSKTKVQQDVDDIRTCQTKRSKAIKKLEDEKERITSIEEWNKLWL